MNKSIVSKAIRIGITLYQVFKSLNTQIGVAEHGNVFIVEHLIFSRVNRERIFDCSQVELN